MEGGFADVYTECSDIHDRSPPSVKGDGLGHPQYGPLKAGRRRADHPISLGVLRGETVEVKDALIRRHEEEHTIALMCGLLSFSRSGYYEWRDRPTPSRTKADESLLRAIRRIYDDHKGRIGSPRITWALRHEGRRVGKNRVARLMRQKALRAKAARKYKATTHSDHNWPMAPNLLNQDKSPTSEPKVGFGHHLSRHRRGLALFLPWCSTSTPARSWAGPCPNG